MALKTTKIYRGDIWLYNPDPVRGGEIGKKLRPCLILSTDSFNQGPTELVIIVPLTSKDKRNPAHVKISPADGGLKTPSFALCEQIRAISTVRLVKKWGMVTNPMIFREISKWITTFLNL